MELAGIQVPDPAVRVALDGGAERHVLTPPLATLAIALT